MQKDRECCLRHSAPASWGRAWLAAVGGGTQGHVADAGSPEGKVLAHYAALAHAVYEDSLITAQALAVCGEQAGRRAVGAIRSPLRAPPGWLPACPTSRARSTASATPSWMTGKARSTPGRSTRA